MYYITVIFLIIRILIFYFVLSLNTVHSIKNGGILTDNKAKSWCKVNGKYILNFSGM